MPSIPRPAPSEYAPYYRPYVEAVPDGDILATLAAQEAEFAALAAAFGEGRARHRYAPGKWSVNEVCGHLLDTERVFGFRALWFARGAAGPLPSMEQDAWVAAARFDERSLAEIVAALGAARRQNVELLRGLTGDELARGGVASGREVTVRALAWIMAGHARHHLGVLRERYG